MITPQTLADAFNAVGLDTPEKLKAFLKPAAISAELASFDGKLADLANKQGEALSGFQAQKEELIRQRAEAQRKLEEGSKAAK